MRKLILAISVGATLTALFASSTPASANVGQSHRTLACIGNGHSCTHNDNCCSGNCVSRTCK